MLYSGLHHPARESETRPLLLIPGEHILTLYPSNLEQNLMLYETFIIHLEGADLNALSIKPRTDPNDLPSFHLASGERNQAFIIYSGGANPNALFMPLLSIPGEQIVHCMDD